MRNNETGEFELVVGNHQLLSGFFIVVLLFAVAFAMGYVVGQNSPRSAKPQSEAAPPANSGTLADNRPQPAGPVPQPPAAQTSAAEPAAPGAAAGDSTPAADTPPQPMTQPARDPQAASTVPASLSPPPAAPAVSGAINSPDSLPAGSFWQVIAVAQTDADLIGKTLKDKGFPVVLVQGPNNLVRILVGPYTDVQAMGKAKNDLVNAGFLHPFRYQR